MGLRFFSEFRSSHSSEGKKEELTWKKGLGRWSTCRSVETSIWDHPYSAMFGGMFQKKPSKEEALPQLRSHELMFGAWVVAIRVTPYFLQYFSRKRRLLWIFDSTLPKLSDLTGLSAVAVSERLNYYRLGCCY